MTSGTAFIVLVFASCAFATIAGCSAKEGNGEPLPSSGRFVLPGAEQDIELPEEAILALQQIVSRPGTIARGPHPAAAPLGVFELDSGTYYFTGGAIGRWKDEDRTVAVYWQDPRIDRMYAALESAEFEKSVEVAERMMRELGGK